MDSIRWEAYEYEERERSSDWFWAVGIIAIALAVTSIIYGNLLFAIFVIVASFTMLLYAARAPRLIQFEINNKGIVAQNTLYPFNTIESFCIHEKPHHSFLVLKSQRILMPTITIPLHDEIDIDFIHSILRERIAEEEIHPSLSEAIMDYFGF